MTTGQRLAQVQRDGHARLDAIYASIAGDVEDIVVRVATPDDQGVPRFLMVAVPLVLFAIARRLTAARLPITLAIGTTTREAVVAAEVGFTPLPTWEQSAIVAPVYQQAWESMHDAEPVVLDQTRKLLVRGAAAGLAARTVARQATQYFFHRDPDSGQRQYWPGRANMASERARSVMLTETTRAHARTTMTVAITMNMGMKWNLSSGHSRADQCDSKRQDSSEGQEPGVYLPSEFPGLPSHPRCRCWSSIVPLKHI